MCAQLDGLNTTTNAEIIEVVPSNGRASSIPTAEAGLISCNVCNRSFARLDHLARHLRSRESKLQQLIVDVLSSNDLDSKEKPFTCDICDKNFGRMSVVLLEIMVKLCL